VSRLTAAVAILSATGMMTLFGMVAPAAAELTQSANCQTNYPPVHGFTFKFTGTVFYTTNGTTDHIHALGFRVWGAHTGGKSDAEYSIKENGTEKLSGHTPDNLQPDETRVIPVSVDVAAGAVAQADFRAAFDLAGFDPHCNAAATW
jgi:hypothetical protein